MNLMKDAWATADASDLKLLLKKHFGGHGQYSNADRRKLYLPAGGPTCQIEVTYGGRHIDRIERGVAFDKTAWTLVCARVDQSLLVRSARVGRDFSFSSFRVTGAWQGPRSRLQILPPPPEAPSAPMGMADHPFVLEFPLEASDDWEVTNQRRIRNHKKFTRVLNVLLRGSVSLLPRQQEGFWASIPPREESDVRPDIRWVTQFFFANLGEVVVDEASSTDVPAIEEIKPEAYYATHGHDGGSMRVPSDLDESICRYQTLSQSLVEKFDRAAFWFDLASRLWHLSVSSSFGALVSAVEALTDRGSIHNIKCPACGEKTQHETPGATRRFREFFDAYAPGVSMKRQRDEIYALRSGIFHGSRLMQLDEDTAFYGWDLLDLNERELHRDLWDLVRIALRNWLLSRSN